MENVTIREIGEAGPEVCEFINLLMRQLSSSADPLTDDDLRAIIAAPGVTLLLAYADLVPAGMLTLVVFQTPTGRRALIEDVVVDAAWRGLGIGRALTVDAVERARNARVRKIDLTSTPQRVEANALYRQIGFRPRETNVYRLVP